MRFPRRSTDMVRSCEIFTHDGFGSFVESSARLSGKPARCGWLVMAIAMTVSDR